MSKRGENIYKRKDGRWEGRVRIKNNGIYKYKYIYGKNYKTVKKKMLSFDSSKISECTIKTIDVLFDEWFSAIQFSVKKSTFCNYKMKAFKYILPEFGKYKFNELRSNMITEFISEKIKSGLSAGYVCDIIAVFRAMSKYICRIYGYSNIFSDIVLPKHSPREIVLLTDDQQKVLYKTLSNNINGTTICILLSLFTGVRIGEVCALTWSDVDSKENTLHISKTVQRIHDAESSSTRLIIDSPKSNSSKRIIPIPVFLAEILKENKRESDVYIISENRNLTEPRTLQRRFKSILKNCNLPDIHYHSLRHMFATNCIKLGFDVKTLSEILGHSSVEITLKRYVHSSLERKFECMSLIAPDI